MKNPILVTPALPYANGAPHLGHLVENIQVNVFTRALRMAGEDVLYVCGADSHGTPIELKAAEAGVSPEEFTEKHRAVFESVFARYMIEFDEGLGTTHTPLGQEHAERIYRSLQDGGYLVKRNIEQLFDPEAKRFLADRMVKGSCPKCHSEDQYGDSCESCGSTYRPTELSNPKSVISGATPELRSSEHIFVNLGAFTDRLQEWTKTPGVVNEDVQNYLKRWYDEGLKDWDISRDAPYHGFPIPGETDKYFYVWLDAPIGYISLTERAASSKGRRWEDYWCNPDAKIYHFIGKDIVYFHTLFWPAMLMSAGYTLPEQIAVHGMLTVNGVKMSKSRGTFLLAEEFVDQLGETGAQALRYYFACKLTSRVEDIDLSLEDFTFRVNADLVNKIVNLVSRTVPMLHRNHEGKIGELDGEAMAMWDEVRALGAPLENAYRELDFARITRDVVSMADIGNRYLQEQKPWDTVKTDAERAHRQLTTALTIGKSCMALLKPILPVAVEKLERMLQMDPTGFTFANALETLPTGLEIAPYERLFERLDPKQVAKLVHTENDKQEKKKEKAPQKQQQKKANPKADTGTKVDDGIIKIDDFMRVELRAAKVVGARDVDGADSLISLDLDVGALGKRHVFSGLKPHVAPADMVGKMVVVVANLKPRKMRFGLSEGMILASGDEVPAPLFVPDAKPGDRIR